MGFLMVLSEYSPRRAFRLGNAGRAAVSITGGIVKVWAWREHPRWRIANLHQ